MFASCQSIKEGVCVMNGVDDDRFPLLVARVAQAQIASSEAFSSSEREKLETSLELTQSQVTVLLDTLHVIFKQAAYNVAKPATLKEQLLGVGASEEKAAACAGVWANVAKCSIDTLRQRSLHSLQLADVKWSLGAHVSSSAQTGQHAALAKLELQLSNGDAVNVQMDHAQLYHMYSQLERVQAQLDGLK